MRARLGLAQTLEELDRNDEAIAHYRELLRLDAGDNQGVRYALLSALLVAERDAESAALIEQFGDDPTATWHYGRALVTFRREGDSRATRCCARPSGPTAMFRSTSPATTSGRAPSRRPMPRAAARRP
jgi:hypothetical protein